MTGKSPSDFSDWNALWGDAQQKYWQSWLDLTRQAAGQAPEPPANPWKQGFDMWAKALGGAAPAESRDWMSKLADVNRGFLLMGEQIWKMVSSGQGAPANPETWLSMVSQGLKQAKVQAAGQSSGEQDPWAGFATFWGLPVDTWRRVASACSTVPGDMEKALRGLSRDGAEGPWSGLLSMPSLGYTREWQEELQQLQQKWLDHGKAMRTYNLVLEKITSKATEILGKKLFAHDGQAAKPPASLREFYNLWVDCGEEAYAEIAAKPEFTEAQAQLVNTLMAVKRHEQKMVDEVLAGLNMPTRRELDTAHRRIHQLQRQLWELKESQADSGVRELREEVAALQRTIESLRAHLEQPAPEKKAPSRAAKAAS